MKLHLDEASQWTLINALRVAIERYQETATMFRQIQSQGGTGMVTENGARDLAKQFDKQAADAEKMIETLQDIEE